jgi:hypothetical protein
MTGKFHTTWGEFGGFKHPNALRYECSVMLALGSKCSIGDQLHPSGAMDMSTYGIIGAAYEEVEKKQPWCEGAEPVADIGVLSSQAVNGRQSRDDPADTGAGRVLLEGHHLFDLLDSEMEFSPYKLLILPDSIRVDNALEKRVRDYLAQGGKLLLTGQSGLRSDGSGFAFDIGALWESESEYSPDYIVPADGLRPDFVASPFVAYVRSQRVKPTSGESLGDVYDPYFNRTYEHFCSHQHAPACPEPSGYACGVHNEQIMYLAHPVFSLYRGFGAVVQREYILNCIRRLLGGAQTVRCNLPSTARVTLMRQAQHNRLVLHLLYANTVSRGGQLNLSGGTATATGFSLEVVEDLVPLRGVELELAIERKLKRATLQPQGQEIVLQRSNGSPKLTLDEFTCHQMVVLDY